MVALKITVSAAMRARDVSRPTDEQAAAAVARELEAANPGPASEPEESAESAVPAGTVPAGTASRRQRRRTAPS
jgi:hypothetical protein